MKDMGTRYSMERTHAAACAARFGSVLSQHEIEAEYDVFMAVTNGTGELPVTHLAAVSERMCGSRELATLLFRALGDDRAGDIVFEDWLQFAAAKHRLGGEYRARLAFRMFSRDGKTIEWADLKGAQETLLSVLDHRRDGNHEGAVRAFGDMLANDIFKMVRGPNATWLPGHGIGEKEWMEAVRGVRPEYSRANWDILSKILQDL